MKEKRQKDQKRERSCGAVILRYPAGILQVLVIHSVQGHWCFPKGHMKKGETERKTAEREIKEETGLAVSLNPRFHTQVSYAPKPGVMKDVIYFTGTVKEGKEKRQKEEVQEIAWVSLEEAYGLLTYDRDVDVLKQACASWKGKGNQA